jgi:hypothetical protein
MVVFQHYFSTAGGEFSQKVFVKYSFCTFAKLPLGKLDFK